jgi:predicted Zn-dependent protease
MDEAREALQAFRDLVRLDPESPLSHFTLGRALFAGREAKQAIDCFETALGLDPDYLLGYLMLGQCAERLGRLAQARSSYQKGLGRAQRLSDSAAISQFTALLGTLGVDAE